MYSTALSSNQGTKNGTAVKRPFRDAADAYMPTRQLGENGCPEFTNFGIGSDLLALSQMVRGGDPVSLCSNMVEIPSVSAATS